MEPKHSTISLESVPEELTERPQWVLWRLEVRGEKPTKIPYNPNTGRRASTTDLSSWGTFAEAREAFEDGRYDGVGFVFCSADPFVGLDFDNCRNLETGVVDQRVLEYVRKFEDGYVEASPSGTGVHLITRGRCKDGAKSGNFEIYGQDRFFTVTGEVI